MIRTIVYTLVVIVFFMVVTLYMDMRTAVKSLVRIEAQNEYLRGEVARLDKRLESGIKEFYEMHKEPSRGWFDHGHDKP